jgi:D-alanyl-lipoteichoic acid acyltransferase DltB (MBOAT superfamily)
LIQDLRLVVGILAYVAAARAALRVRPAWRDRALAAVNVVTVAWMYYSVRSTVGRALIGAYVVLVVAQWALTRALATRRGAAPWVALLSPILALALARYVPLALGEPWRELWLRASAVFVGLSYMAFRLSYLVLEVRNGAAMPGLTRYLGFAFFPPTFAVGPISPYALYEESLAAVDVQRPPLGQALLRIATGLVKYMFLGPLFNQLSYAGLELGKRPHPPLDWAVAGLCYFLFLYCNFSGFCDVGIGAAGAIGIRVRENFDHPFAARNVKDFWNRWHITLSTYMRDTVFTPLSKALVRRFGPAHANHAVALAIFVVFVLVGVWHGVGSNFFVFGVLHALAIVANHYYGLALKKVLGKARLRAYNENRVVHAVAVAATFTYVTFTVFFFANADSVARAGAFLRGHGS